jgi:hypothetical protein
MLFDVRFSIFDVRLFNSKAAAGKVYFVDCKPNQQKPLQSFASLAPWRFKFFKPENKAIGKMRETHECMGVPMSLPSADHNRKGHEQDRKDKIWKKIKP